MQRHDLKLLAFSMLPWWFRGACLLAVVLLLGGCSSQRPLMPTPDVYALGIMQPFADTLPAELKTVDANIMYATDRVPETREDGRLDYGMGRDHTLAIGEAVVNIDDIAKAWADYYAHDETASRDSLIQYEGRSGGAHGHNYFRTNPAVSSDLVLTLRFGRPPGAENGRPLEHIDGLFWKVDDDYLRSPKR